MHITEQAPAKINLTLEVLGKRADGYHEIASLVAFARDAADVVELDTEQPVGVEVTGPFGGHISGENLIALTLQKIARAAPELKRGAIRLTKNLPVAAGIGGGSADAAAVLRAVKRANSSLADRIDWMGIAASLGADVPVCFANQAAWMTGIGEKVSQIDNLPLLSGVLVNPLQPMPLDKTARVFKALNAPPITLAANAPIPPGPFSHAHVLLEYMQIVGNALDAAVVSVAAVTKDIKRALAETDNCRYLAISGAGPTCFGIFDDAEKATAQLTAKHPAWWVRPVIIG